jgi:fatty-acyl-CoA synthase
MQRPTPTSNSSLSFLRGAFETLAEGLDYAAKGETGCNFYSIKGELQARIGYGEMREDAISLARKLIKLGLEPGSRVALVAETTPDFHCFFYACQYASLLPMQLPVPMNLGAKEAYLQQIRRMIASARPAAAMASPNMIGMLREAIGDFEVAMVGTPDEFRALPEGPDLRPAGPDDLSYIQYSSGSTSEPKGIVISQRAIISNTRAIMTDGLDAREGDRCASWLPLYHDMGLVGFSICPMLTQLSIDYLATSDFARRPLLWLRLISENGGSLAFSPSFGYDLCQRRASNGSEASIDLSSWRVAGIGGDMVRAGVLNRFTECFAQAGFKRSAFVPSYGLAETTLAASFAPLDEEFQVDRVDKRELAESGKAVPATADTPAEDARSLVLCGKAMSGHEIEIRDDDGAPLPDRQIGRVLIKGPSLMSGFFEEPERTATVLSEDGWLDTGDLGYMIDGSLVVTGRDKDLIICNGRNIWPQDIEWAVERLEGIKNGDVAAFSVESTENGEEVVTVVQCRSREEDVRESLMHDIATIVRKSVGVDTKVVLAPVRSLPLTSSGKISRSFTKVRYLSGFFAAPQN